MSALQPVLTEIDLSKTTKKGGAGLEEGPTYLVLYRGRMHTGSFTTVWYGLSFRGIYDAGAQYDPPGENSSFWQRIWRIENADEIAVEAEPEFARSTRAHSIKYRCTSNGQTITEDAPIEAFMYRPKVPAMPRRDDEEDDE